MRPYLIYILVSLTFCAEDSRAQQLLNNDTVLKMHASGLSDEIIVSTVNSQPGTYSTGVDDLIALKQAGASDKVIAAIIIKNGAGALCSIEPAASNTLPPTAQPAPTQTYSNPAAPSTPPKVPPAVPIMPRVFLQSSSHGNTVSAARDQSMEMSKDFEQECPGVRITLNQQMADYTVNLNHIEMGLFVRDNQIQIADKSGDLISKTKEGGSIAGAVKKACALILWDWGKSHPAPLITRPS